MRCPTCSSRLRVSHVFNAGDTATTRTAVCPGCKASWTTVEVVVARVEAKGQGAHALAQKIRAEGLGGALPKLSGASPPAVDGHKGGA